MNFFQIQFPNTKRFEFKAHDERVAELRAKAWLTRWNQPSCTVYRTNPYDANFQKLIFQGENPDYDPNRESLLQDPKELYLPTEKPAKRKRKASGSSTDGSNRGGHRKTFAVPLKDLAEELGTTPQVIRRKLRAARIEKPSGGWGWDSPDHETVQLIRGWFQ